MSFYWDIDNPERRYERFETPIDSEHPLNEEDIIDFQTSTGFRSDLRILFKVAIYTASKILTQIQFDIFSMYYINHLKQREVGKVLEVSQPYVSAVARCCASKIAQNVDKVIYQKLKKVGIGTSSAFETYVLKCIERNKMNAVSAKIRTNVIKKILINIVAEYLDEELETYKIGESEKVMKDAIKFKKKLIREIKKDDRFVCDILRRILDNGEALESKIAKSYKNSFEDFLSLVEYDFKYLNSKLKD